MKSYDLNASDYWALFAQTGSPEAYMLYTEKVRMEEGNAPEDPSPGPACYGLQRS